MDLNTVFAAVEAAQTALTNGATQLAADQAKAAAIALAVTTDQTNQTGLVAASDAAVNSAIVALQGLLSTATVPVVPAS